MPPTLQRVVLNGASRHRLNKGFILFQDAQRPIDASRRDEIVRATNQGLTQRPELMGFAVEPQPAHAAVIGLTTPFLLVYDVDQRNAFIHRLAAATTVLSQCAGRAGYRLVAAGVNPYFADGSGLPAALCADIHQVEVFDDGEIERIYNLYRQFLPELLAVSTHGSVYAGEIQKDFSLRMRVNPSSFLPRYLSQFSVEQLAKLERMMRKDYGLADLRQMDVNPLGGDAERLNRANMPLLNKAAAAVEVRFADAQYSYPYIRAQLILFQAIAMYGRSLARQGKRLPYMRDEVIDENKALAIQSGAGAVLKPDPKFKKDNSGRGYSYHDKGNAERATTALLMIIDGLLLPSLQDLGCQPWKLAPLLIGAELRRRGKRCLASYAENQQFIFYTHQRQFAAALQQQIEQSLASPEVDPISDYNRKTYPDLVREIETEWGQKLTPRPRYKGRILWYEGNKGQGLIGSEQADEIRVETEDIEGVDRLEVGEQVSFEVLRRGGRSLAVRVRVEAAEQHTGKVVRFDEAKAYGFIRDEAGGDVFVHHSDVIGGAQLRMGDEVTFEVVPQTGSKGPRAVRVHVPEVPRIIGTVKWFDPQKRFGYIARADGQDIFVHQSDLEGTDILKPGQAVTFESQPSPKGPKAVHVRVSAEG